MNCRINQFVCVFFFYLNGQHKMHAEPPSMHPTITQFFSRICYDGIGILRRKKNRNITLDKIPKINDLNRTKRNKSIDSIFLCYNHTTSTSTTWYLKAFPFFCVHCTIEFFRNAKQMLLRFRKCFKCFLGFCRHFVAGKNFSNWTIFLRWKKVNIWHSIEKNSSIAY